MSQEETEPYITTHMDPGTGGLVVSEIDPAEIGEIQFDSFVPQVRRAISAWAEDVQTNPRRRQRGLFGRDKFAPPNSALKILETAAKAAEDDVVSNVLDASEAIAFRKMHFEMEDKDQEDIWNQIARDLNLDEFVRQAWRDLAIYSQFYAVQMMGIKEYQVRGRNSDTGNKRRKKYRVAVPTRISLLDPLRVVPVDRTVFGTERLAWIANESEMESYEEDLEMQMLFTGQYTPSKLEEKELAKNDVPIDRLLLFNPNLVWSHSLTKAPYQRWSDVRMKSIFPLLDLKEQLRDMDRTWLLGGVNFIVLVKRGTDQMPAKVAEVERTTSQFRTQSSGPTIITDHRIEIEIITPDITHVLNEAKWRTIDDRLLMRLWGTFQLPSQSGAREDSTTVGQVIARGLSSRRHMLRRSLERHVLYPVTEIEWNKEQDFDELPKLQFSPRRMELEYDPSVVTFIQHLRDRGDISRETTLAEFGFDQKTEAVRREFEDEEYDGVFEPVNVPFDSKEGVTPDGSGRTGGRPPGTQDSEPRSNENDSD